jgi:hypothetical protein
VAGFDCGVCGKRHDHLPRDIGYRRPDPFLDVPKAERQERAYESDDLCVVDGEMFMIRGVLYLPIDGGAERFGWGIWVTVLESDYYRYLNAWDHDSEDETPPFVGQIANAIAPYPGSRGLDVTVRLRSGGQRPTFTVISEGAPLGIDQRQGISPEKAHSFVAQFA